jgi:hypothetical protein
MEDGTGDAERSLGGVLSSAESSAGCDMSLTVVSAPLRSTWEPSPACSRTVFWLSGRWLWPLLGVLLRWWWLWWWLLWYLLLLAWRGRGWFCCF